MAAVDKTSLNTNPYNTVLDILKNSSYITDPRRGANRRTRKFIYRADPDITSYDFMDYPIIVCRPATKIQSKQSADQKTQEIVWSNRIVIKTVNNGSGQNREDQGIDDMLTLMDQIDQYFESSAVRKDFKDNKLNFMDITTDEALVPIVTDKDTIHETTYTIRYRSRVVVK